MTDQELRQIRTLKLASDIYSRRVSESRSDDPKILRDDALESIYAAEVFMDEWHNKIEKEVDNGQTFAESLAGDRKRKNLKEINR